MGAVQQGVLPPVEAAVLAVLQEIIDQPVSFLLLAFEGPNPNVEGESCMASICFSKRWGL